MSGSASVRLPPPGISNFTALRPGTFGEAAALGYVAPWLFHGVDLNPSSPPAREKDAPVSLPLFPVSLPPALSLPLSLPLPLSSPPASSLPVFSPPRLREVGAARVVVVVGS